MDHLKYNLKKDIVKIMFSSFFHVDIYFDMPINIWSLTALAGLIDTETSDRRADHVNIGSICQWPIQCPN